MSHLSFEEFWEHAVQKKMPRRERYHYKIVARATWECAWWAGRHVGHEEGYKAGVLAATARQGLLKSRIQRILIKIGDFFRRL